MTKDQLNQVKLDHSEAYETVIDGLYEWPQSGLIHELLRWIPQSEFMKMIHQVEKNDAD